MHEHALYVPIVTAHAIGATLALVSGFLALRFPNGTTLHKRIGLLYLAGWTTLFASGVWLGLEPAGISSFEILNAIGVVFVMHAYGTVLFRRRIGRPWLRMHYASMTTSLAFVVIATLNQILPRLGVSYPAWVFWLMVAAPFVVIPPYLLRLDRRYGFRRRGARRTAA